MSKAKSVQITHATATTPAMSMTNGARLSPAEFGAELKHIGNEVKDLVKMARKVGGLKSGQYIEVDGGKFGAKELNKLVSAHVKTVRQLKKNYVEQGKKKKRSAVTKEGKPRRTGDGFSQPSFLEQPLVAFINSANFGSGLKASDLEATLQYGILSRAILTPLLTTYMKVNGLRFEEGGKKFYRAGPEMVASLGPYLAALEKRDPTFDRNKFQYNRIQSVVNPGIRSKDSLDESELQYVANDEIKGALAGIQKKVSAANKAA